MNKAISLLVILFFFLSCEKKIIEIPTYSTNYLEDYEFIEPSMELHLYTDIIDISGLNFSRPKFNPVNPNEFVLFKQNSSSQTELVKFNIFNGKSNVILNQTSIFQNISWGVNDRIIYNDKTSGNLKKIKSNKTEETTLFQNQEAVAYSWNSAGTLFAKSSIVGIGGSSFAMSIFDENGNKIRDLNVDGIIRIIDWKNNIIAFSTDSYPASQTLKILDLTTNEITSINSTYTNSDVFYSIKIVDEKYVLWNNQEIIARTNIETKETEIIKELGRSGNFRFLDVSQNEEKIIFSAWINYEIDSTTLKGEKMLFMMNIDGTNVNRIHLPE